MTVKENFCNLRKGTMSSQQPRLEKFMSSDHDGDDTHPSSQYPQSKMARKRNTEVATAFAYGPKTLSSTRQPRPPSGQPASNPQVEPGESSSAQSSQGLSVMGDSELGGEISSYGEPEKGSTSSPGPRPSGRTPVLYSLSLSLSLLIIFSIIISIKLEL